MNTILAESGSHDGLTQHPPCISCVNCAVPGVRVGWAVGTTKGVAVGWSDGRGVAVTFATSNGGSVDCAGGGLLLTRVGVGALVDTAALFCVDAAGGGEGRVFGGAAHAVTTNKSAQVR